MKGWWEIQRREAVRGRPCSLPEQKNKQQVERIKEVGVGEIVQGRNRDDGGQRSAVVSAGQHFLSQTFTEIIKVLETGQFYLKRTFDVLMTTDV